jgi:orotidine-5'-phosphate decarboxylase
VTVLTSLGDAELREVGVAAPVGRHVIRLARLAQRAGLDGVVASPHEIAAVRRACGPGFLVVTPGVRPAGAEVQDQKRVATPAAAIAAGASYVVMSRPILSAADPAAAADDVVIDMARGARARRREEGEPCRRQRSRSGSWGSWWSGWG